VAVENVAAAVAEQVVAVTGSDRVRQALVDRLASALVAKRVETAARLVAAHETTTIELSKVKPKPVGVDADGRSVGEPLFTPQQHQERQKLTKRLQRVETLLRQAFEQNKWDEAEKFNPGAKEDPPQEDAT